MKEIDDEIERYTDEQFHEKLNSISQASFDLWYQANKKHSEHKSQENTDIMNSYALERKSIDAFKASCQKYLMQLRQTKNEQNILTTKNSSSPKQGSPRSDSPQISSSPSSRILRKVINNLKK